MSPLDLAIMAGFVLLGAATQRISGMGFALIASPFLVILLGVGNGVPMTQVLSLVSSFLVLSQVWRNAEVRRALWLFGSALLGIAPGLWLSHHASDAILQIVIGTLVIIALVAMLVSKQARIFTGRGGMISAGFLAGFLNFTAGVGGPPVVLYALSIDWRHDRFVATSQLFFVGLNAASLVGHGLPTVPGRALVLAIACVLVGNAIGNGLARRVSPQAARLLVIIVALGGSLATVAKGIWAL